MNEKTEKLAQTISGAVTKNRKRLMGFGILFVILGIIGTYMSVAMTMASILILGIFVIIAGVLYIIEAFSAPDWVGKIFDLIVAFLYIVLGILIVLYPAASAAWFTLFLAGFFMIVGVIRIISGLMSKEEVSGWGWRVFGGLLSLTLGIMIVAQLPESGLWVIGLFISIELIIQGVNAIVLSQAIKEAHKEISQ
jgi:uncharacterized membrane protein HdeD (DUF308 family)